VAADAVNLSFPEPTQDERAMALLVHVLAIFSGFIVPLIFYLVKKDSRFVSFHSLQVLIWHAAYVVTFIAGMMITFAFMIFSIASHPHGAPGEAPPLAFFGLFGFVWLWVMGGWVSESDFGNRFCDQGESRRVGEISADRRFCSE
jgi:uncharacterized Tic20 family protein